METRHYTIDGMTCDHCVRSVREEVGDVAGVTSVDVDLDSGAMAVTGHGIDKETVAAAVSEAGYEVRS